MKDALDQESIPVPQSRGVKLYPGRFSVQME